MRGWISLHRQILENPVVCKDSDYFSVWCYLMLNATHKPYKVLFKNEKIELQPGQLITGRKSIASQFKISESKVQRILKKLEIEQQIEQQTSNANRLITVVNWGLYQNVEQQNEQPVNNERTTDEQPVNTNNNINNKNNIKKKELNISFESFWDLYDKKSGKKKSEIKWGSLTNQDREDIMEFIPRYKKVQPDKKFRKDPMTFFNNESWKDEIINSGDNKFAKEEKSFFDDGELILGCDL